MPEISAFGPILVSLPIMVPEFIEELINEYNVQCEGLLDIRRSDISKIQIEEEYEDEEDEDDDEA